MRRSGRRLLTMAPLLLAGVGLWLGGQGAWLYAKAGLAQLLLEQAWADSHNQQTPAKPWPWADTWPVARLRVPGKGIDLIVLAGDSGRTLAFGPGHSSGSAMPGTPGTTVISGHRDTHFRFLATLKAGDELVLDGTHSHTRYTVTSTRVVDQRQFQISANGNRLVLITCYPFDAIVPGGPLRYIVEADPADATRWHQPVQ